MSFSRARGQMNPVVSYYYDTGAQQRYGAMHVLFCFGLLTAALVFFVTRAVTSNVQLVSAEPSLPGLGAPAPAPAAISTTSSIPNTNDLQADINTWIQAHKGVDWAVSVEAVDGGMSASVNSDKIFTLASIYKLFLLQPLAQKIPSNKWASTPIESKSYADCVDAMLRVSDNVCAEAIGNKLGWAQSEKHLRSLGYAKTAFIGKTTTGTASETAAFLKNLYLSEGFDELARSSVLDAMRAPKSVEGIRRGCQGCTVYNKTGDLAGYHNDAAIIEKNGKAYTLVIFSKTGSWQQIAELTKVISAHF